MPLFGSHLSIAGGLYKAANAAGALGMDTVQIFTASPQMWAVSPATASEHTTKKSAVAATRKIPPPLKWSHKPLGDEEVRLFRAAVAQHNLRVPCAHDSYLINLASPADELRERSIAAFTVELERAEALGLAGVVMHPGTPTDGDEAAGLKRIVVSLNEVLAHCRGFKVQVWIETTAGQGATLGHRFEHLAQLRTRVQAPERIGVCVDTCHILAAGYDIRTPQTYAETMEQLDAVIGLKHVRAFHLNDSKKALGTRVDRHEHIGEGEVGLEAFRCLLNDPRFVETPMYLETKKEKRDDEEMDAVNLRVLKGLLKRRVNHPQGSGTRKSSAG